MRPVAGPVMQGLAGIPIKPTTAGPVRLSAQPTVVQGMTTLIPAGVRVNWRTDEPSAALPGHRQGLPQACGTFCGGDGHSVMKFLTAVLSSHSVLEQYTARVMAQHDTNLDGKLSCEELTNAVDAVFAVLKVESSYTPQERAAVVHFRMRRHDLDRDGLLDAAEFTELCRWILWRRYEELENPVFRRNTLTGDEKTGVVSQFYEIGRKLGEGAFGVVNEVTDRATGDRRVMKTVNKFRCMQSGMPLQMVRREIDILAHLDHPNVLRLFEHYGDPQNLYLILDYCSGGELMDVFEERARTQTPVPEPWVARVFHQVLEAIGYIHAKGVMHKDLKFENIMLREKVIDCSRLEQVHAMVIDVGLSELFGAQHGKTERSSTIAGTVDTMAPEVLLRDFSYKCDIWSLGCMLFALFNPNVTWVPNAKGEQEPKAYPFLAVATLGDPCGLESIRAAQSQPLPLHHIARASPGLQSAVRQMLTFNENQRPSAADCLRMPWFAGGAEGYTTTFSTAQAASLVRERSNQLWWRATMMQAATELPASSLAPLVRLFKSVDVNKDGFTSQEELVAALVQAGVPAENAVAVGKTINFQNMGRLEFSDFVAAVLPGSLEIFCQGLQVAFQKFDVNRDGYLDREEVLQLLKGGDIAKMHLPPEKTVELMIRKMDSGGDGCISYAEFQDFFLNMDDDTVM